MFKKWKLLFFYIKTIKNNLNVIRNHFMMDINKPYYIRDIKLDSVYRLYTVLNFTPETQQSMRKYGYYYMDNEVKKFIEELNNQLRLIGLFELVGLSKVDQLNPYSVLVIVEFKYLRTIKIARNLIILGILAVITSLFIFL